MSLVAACGGSGTPVVIYITATPIPTLDVPTAIPEATALFGPTLDPALEPTAAITFRPLPTFTRAVITATPALPTLTPSFTPEFTETPIPRPPTGRAGTQTAVAAATAGTRIAVSGSARNCTVQLQPNGFTTIYQRDTAVASALGCPLSAAIPINSATLPFEAGQMVWASVYADQPRKVIYALFNNGGYGRFDDNWFDGVDAVDTGEAAPAGKKAPIRGFGKVWKNNPTARALGWALADEAGTTGQIQRFERGEMLFVASVGQTYIFVDGRWRADGTGF